MKPSPNWASLPPKFREALVRKLKAAIITTQAKEQQQQAEADFRKQEGERVTYQTEKERCAKDILHWFDTWVWTYDPRLAGKIDAITRLPLNPFIRFKLWPKQREFVVWVCDRIAAGEPWVLEKSRDQGATYLMAAIFVWFWLFVPGFKATFGSADADLVDNLNDPDSIFEKMRIIYRRLPPWMMPAGFDGRKHDNIMQLTNPQTGATITGDAGDEMGRGGRCTVYVVDEAAFVRHPAKIERALSATTDCVGWVSTVNPQEGMGNFFARKRHAMPDRLVYRLHWRDDPRKTQEWADWKKSTLSDELAWEAEYEINYTANTAGTCIPAIWVRSAQLLAKMLPHVVRSSRGITGGDVGGGKALSVVVHRFGPIVLKPESRKEADTTDTAKWMMRCCDAVGSSVLNFDSPGIGAGVLSTLTKADESEDAEIKAIASRLQRVAINTGNPGRDYIHWPDGRSSEEMFGNLKMEIWWMARNRFQRSHWHYLHLTKQEGGHKQLESEIVILPDSQDSETMSMISQLSLPLYGRNERGKLVLESKEKMAKRQIPSPDHADAYVLTELEELDTLTGIRLDVETTRQENPYTF